MKEMSSVFERDCTKKFMLARGVETRALKRKFLLMHKSAHGLYGPNWLGFTLS
jgi:hypothetical protein